MGQVGGRLCCLLHAKYVRITSDHRGRRLTSRYPPALATYECLITIDYEHSFLRGRQRTLPSIAVSAIKYLSVVIAVLQMVQIHADVSDMTFEWRDRWLTLLYSGSSIRGNSRLPSGSHHPADVTRASRCSASLSVCRTGSQLVSRYRPPEINPCSQFAAFSALRVWALTRHNFWLSGIVLLLSLVPFVENVVRPSAIPVSGITSEHSEVSIYPGIKPLYHAVLP